MKKTVPALPLYEKLKAELLEYIRVNQPRLLPGENELAESYQLSRTTVRRALRDLTDSGVIRPVQGLGTLVNSPNGESSCRFILLLVDPNWGMFAQDIFRRLLTALRDYGLTAMLAMADANSDLRQLDFLLAQSEGVILDPWLSRNEKLYQFIRQSGKKSVALRWISPFSEESFVTEDVPGGYELLTRHLLELGHRDIAILCYLGDGLHAPGIERAMAQYGLAPDPALTISDLHDTRRGGYEAAAELLRRGRKFTAIIAHNDLMALGIMERLLEAGIRIPDDVSIVGSDNIADAAHYPVPLTTMCGDHDAMVNEAIRILLRKDDAAVHTVFPARLIIRKSTAPANP